MSQKLEDFVLAILVCAYASSPSTQENEFLKQSLPGDYFLEGNFCEALIMQIL